MAHGQPEGWVSRRDWFSSLTVAGAGSDWQKSLCPRYLKLGETNVVPRIQKGHTETDLLAYHMSEVPAKSCQEQKWEVKTEELQVKIITSLRGKCRENSLRNTETGLRLH